MNAPKIMHSDGLLRRAFTVSDLFAMTKAGIIGFDERVELIHGELIMMAAKGNRHEGLKLDLNMFLVRNLPEAAKLIPEGGWQIDDITYMEPDFILFPASLSWGQVRPSDALLVIEISDTTLGYDLGVKAGIYAGLGVRDYWVIDVVKRETHIHRAPARNGFGEKRIAPAGETLEPLLVPSLHLALSQFPA